MNLALALQTDIRFHLFGASGLGSHLLSKSIAVSTSPLDTRAGYPLRRSRLLSKSIAVSTLAGAGITGEDCVLALALQIDNRLHYGEALASRLLSKVPKENSSVVIGRAFLALALQIDSRLHQR